MDAPSLWQKISTRSKTFPALKDQLEIDILIIGGGITGVTAANHLIAAGKKVALIDAGKIGGVTTSHSTGNLYIPIQPYYFSLEKKFNINWAKTVAQSRQLAIDYIENTVKHNNINCHFSRRPWFAYTQGENEAILNKEFEVLKKIGLDVKTIRDLPFDLKIKKAFSLDNQARFNPLQYVISLAENLQERGCLIYENTFATAIEEKKTICEVQTTKAKIIANKVFMATHVPIGVNITQSYVAPYRSYVVVGELSEGQKIDAHFWDFDGEKHSTCTHAGENNQLKYILVADRHHKTGQGKNENTFQKLADYLARNFSIANNGEQWSAQHYHAADNIPYIGLASKNSKHVYMATGFFADGLVYGTIAAQLFADAIINRNAVVPQIFNSNRSTFLASLGFLLKENLNVFKQYAKDLPNPFVKKESAQLLKKGEGEVIEINREKCAVYRDQNDKLHILSAVCPHMKCIVKWNGIEGTWDCPCHGSRFTAHGEYIEGPALSGLTSKNV